MDKDNLDLTYNLGVQVSCRKWWQAQRKIVIQRTMTAQKG